MNYIPEQWSSFVPGPVQPIEMDWANGRVSMLRLDLIESWATGNKYFKLKYNLRDALQRNITPVVSKGGMFSNHLHALAEACHFFGVKCVCIIRSYQDDAENPTLQFLRAHHCELIFLAPDIYNTFDADEAERLFPGCYFIDEGGESQFAIEGSGEILNLIDENQFQQIVISGGTVTTVAGMLKVASANQHIYIVPAWKGCTNDFVNSILKKYNINPCCSWSLWPDFHFGGFAKANMELAEFMHSFTTQTFIPLDPVYTGKMMFAIRQKMLERQIDEGHILAIHTGGLQGIAGAYYRNPKLWFAYRELCKLIVRE